VESRAVVFDTLSYVTPDAEPNSPRISLGAETETGRGWRYALDILWPDGTSTTHEATLSWSDHDHLCGGTQAPSRVMEAVVRLATGVREALPPRFDASTVRRWCPAMDSELVL